MTSEQSRAPAGAEVRPTPSPFRKRPPLKPGALLRQGTLPARRSLPRSLTLPSPPRARGQEGEPRARCRPSWPFPLPRLVFWLPVKQACARRAESHLVHFRIHHERPALGGAWSLQRCFKQRPAVPSGVRQGRRARGNDLPLLVSLSNKDKLRTHATFALYTQPPWASWRTEPPPQPFLVWGPGFSPSCEEGAVLQTQNGDRGLRLPKQGSGKLPEKLPPDT